MIELHEILGEDEQGEYRTHTIPPVTGAKPRPIGEQEATIDRVLETLRLKRRRIEENEGVWGEMGTYGQY